MGKKPKAPLTEVKLDPEEFEKELREFEKELREDAGMGVSTKFADRSYWLGEEVDYYSDWFEAFMAVDERKDKEPLLQMLKEAEVGGIPVAVIPHLRDLLNRHNLKRKRGQQRTPSYNLSKAEICLDFALQCVSERKRGVTPEEALAEAARTYHVKLDTLRYAHNGQMGSRRRRVKKAKK